MTTPLASVPIRSFDAGLTRLEAVMEPDGRRRLAQALATRTIRALAANSLDVAVVTADDGVVRWCAERKVRVIRDPGRGLDAAATAAAEDAITRGVPWLVVHADLPFIRVEAVRRVLEAMSGSPVIVPAHDGGTNVIGGESPTDFAYGPGSFHRHLARIPHAAVVTGPHLGIDLDTVSDLESARRLALGRWLMSFEIR